MFDIRWIRENPDAFDAGLARRGLSVMAARAVEIDGRRRACQTELQEIQARRNEASKAIGTAKGKGDHGAADALMKEVGDLKERTKSLEEDERLIVAELDAFLAGIPNLLAEDVPAGKSEADNVELRRVGTPPTFGFNVKDHVDLGAGLGQMDFEGAAKMSGSRFVVLKSGLARLERALGDFMLDLHTREHGYTEISPPLLVRDEAVFGTGQLPKFKEELFRTTDGRWLIPTSEVPVTNLVRESILDEDALPLRLTARTPNFRSEAGAAGKDTRGMIRHHQFWKVELVSITRPEDGPAEHERMLACAEEVLKRLDITYRVVTLCAGDTGFSARKTYDLEVWLPGQGGYREIASHSWCGDFQARRMDARYRPKEGKGTRYLHTLNGSGLAIGRTLIAVLENYQQADGSITIPEALRPFMGGQAVIAAHG
jgi:seryl-tRNA synthetase